MIFVEQKSIWKPKIFLTYFFYIFKHILKIIFISNVLFLIILHVCEIIS